MTIEMMTIKSNKIHSHNIQFTTSQTTYIQWDFGL